MLSGGTYWLLNDYMDYLKELGEITNYVGICNILKLSEKRSRATSLFCVLPMVIVTAIMYSRNNYIDWWLGIKCAIGGIIGGIIGSKLLDKIPAKYLKISFIVFLFYAGVSLILR